MTSTGLLFTIFHNKIAQINSLSVIVIMYSKREYINTLSFILICVLIQVIIFLFILFSNTSSLQLDQVIILSRHNVRSPLSKNLEQITTERWPKWKENPGYLTDKGFLLEGYMGNYFLNWLYKESIIDKNCPNDEEFYVYANSMQRTIYSAKAFISHAFPKCNVTIHTASIEPDPIFSPLIHNTSAIFKDIALKEMTKVLDNLNLVSSYYAMENILNYKDSKFCKMYNKCDLASDKNKIEITVGKKPKVTGPLKICNEATDAFLMAYYDGFPLQDIAWGKLDNMEKWDSILSLTASYHNVTFNTTHIAKDIARPLLQYIKDIFLNKDTKVTLLMGHDANINVLLNAMSFKPYKLDKSFVSTPIGGKIVFQKWYDGVLKQYLLKVEYIYQTNEQLRNAQILTFKNPPIFAPLELEYCKVNENGFCLWDDFIYFLNNL